MTSQTAHSHDHHTALLNTRIWQGAYSQAVAPGITRPLQATGWKGVGEDEERARFLKLLRVRVGFKFFRCGAGANKSFNPCRTLIVTHGNA